MTHSFVPVYLRRLSAEHGGASNHNAPLNSTCQRSVRCSIWEPDEVQHPKTCDQDAVEMHHCMTHTLLYLLPLTFPRDGLKLEARQAVIPAEHLNHSG